LTLKYKFNIQSRIEIFALPPPNVGDLSPESQTKLNEWREELTFANKEIEKQKTMFEKQIELKTLTGLYKSSQKDELARYEPNIREAFNKLLQNVRLFEQKDLDAAISRINLFRQIIKDTEEEKEEEVIDADVESDRQRDLKDLSDYISGSSSKVGFINWSKKLRPH